MGSGFQDIYDAHGCQEAEAKLTQALHLVRVAGRGEAMLGEVELGEGVGKLGEEEGTRFVVKGAVLYFALGLADGAAKLADFSVEGGRFGLCEVVDEVGGGTSLGTPLITPH